MSVVSPVTSPRTPT